MFNRLEKAIDRLLPDQPHDPPFHYVYTPPRALDRILGKQADPEPEGVSGAIHILLSPFLAMAPPVILLLWLLS